MKDDIKPGEQLTLAQINRIRKQSQAKVQHAPADPEGTPPAKPKELTVPEIKEALAAKGIDIPKGVTKKPDLQKLLDDAGERERASLIDLLTERGIEFDGAVSTDELRALSITSQGE